MPRLDVEHRTKIIEFWHQTKSVTQVQRLYAAHFNIHKRNAPQPRTIRSTVMKFTREGSVCDRNKGRSGRPRTSRSDPNVAIVRESVVRSPRQSIRRLSSETDIPRSSVQRILRQDIHAYPYKIQSQTELTNEQKQKRVDFANRFSGKLEEDEDFLKKIHMTDECHAHLSGVVNSQNYRYWGTHNPGNAATEQVPRSVLKVTMWVAIGWYGIIGPYFFEDAQGRTCTVNQENYREMIRQFYLPELRIQSRQRNLIQMRTQWFQQDGAPPHTARETRHFINQHFQGRFISLYEDVEWPPYSPDLTPPDFFLWGYLKDRIYSNPRPQNLDQLKENIQREIGNIPPETFQNVMTNMTTRLQTVIGQRGAYIEHVV